MYTNTHFSDQKGSVSKYLCGAGPAKNFPRFGVRRHKKKMYYDAGGLIMR